MRELTPRQAAILAFVREEVARRGGQPSYREIGAKFGISPRAVLLHIAALERKGALHRSGKGQARALALTGGVHCAGCRCPAASG